MNTGLLITIIVLQLWIVVRQWKIVKINRNDAVAIIKLIKQINK